VAAAAVAAIMAADSMILSPGRVPRPRGFRVPLTDPTVWLPYQVIKELSRSPGMEKNNLADLHPQTFYSTLIANKWQEVEHHYPDFVRCEMK